MTNRVILAAAGSRKSSFLVEEALRARDKRTLLTTFTVENTQQLRNYITQRSSVVPGNIRVATWYTFLLSQCVRPYQNFVYSERRIENISFVKGASTRFAGKQNVKRYYLADGRFIYTDKLAEFACRCNEASKGLVIRRLECLFDRIFIDEAQDLAGYDFELLELLLQSRIALVIVGDCRQATYFTNYSPKNRRSRGYNIIDLFHSWEEAGLCQVEERNESYRSNQQICDFADRLYPELAPTISRNNEVTPHGGVFVVRSADVLRYVMTYNPKVLRDKVTTPSQGLEALNFGMSKGQTFDHVLIFPNGPIRQYLASGNPTPFAQRTKALFYVGVTRARHSVAIVYDGEVHDNMTQIFH